MRGSVEPAEPVDGCPARGVFAADKTIILDRFQHIVETLEIDGAGSRLMAAGMVRDMDMIDLRGVLTNEGKGISADHRGMEHVE